MTAIDPAALAAEYLDLKDKAAQIDDRVKQIVAQLRALGEGKHEAGAATVVVGAVPHRFDARKAAEVLASNPELLAQVSETVVSSTKAKQLLAPAVYALCSVENGEPRVTVRA